MRTMYTEYYKGRLINGFDGVKQALVRDGKYQRCYHPEDMICNCYGRIHEGEETESEK